MGVMPKPDDVHRESSISKDKETIDLTISLLAANLYGGAAGAVPALLALILFLFIWSGEGVAAVLTGFAFLHLIAALVTGIVVHEGLHAIGWMVFGRMPRSAIKIGVKWELLTPYAHSREPMPVNGYRWGTALPGLLMGVLPSILAVILGNGFLLLFGAFFTAAAGGDFLVLWLLRDVPKGALVEDHPSRVGCIVHV